MSDVQRFTREVHALLLKEPNGVPDQARFVFIEVPEFDENDEELGLFRYVASVFLQYGDSVVGLESKHPLADLTPPAGYASFIWERKDPQHAPFYWVESERLYRYAMAYRRWVIVESLFSQLEISWSIPKPLKANFDLSVNTPGRVLLESSYFSYEDRMVNGIALARSTDAVLDTIRQIFTDPIFAGQYGYEWTIEPPATPEGMEIKRK